ncbi:MAG: cell division protein FtsQ/DivIB [Gammaproteobacteria bacterium]|nr:cell division protein FtsQ/DivIB [Gammaproteobacteria bacterium]
MAKRKPISRPDKNQRGLLKVFALIVVALLIAAWMKLNDPTFMTIDYVRIDGDFKHLPKNIFEQRITPFVTGGFFSIDLDNIYQVANDYPWIESVSVKRIWPNGLHVLVKEQQPVALWDGQRFLNARGEIVNAKVKGAKDLPLLSGPDGQEHLVLDYYRQLKSQFANIGLSVDVLTLDARNNWLLQTSQGITVKMGRENLEERVARFVNAFAVIKSVATDQAGGEEAGDEKGSAKGNNVKEQVFDLRYTNGFAVSKLHNEISQKLS